MQCPLPVLSSVPYLIARRFHQGFVRPRKWFHPCFVALREMLVPVRTSVRAQVSAGARPKASLELGCISASGHWRQSTSALPWSALPSTMDIAAIAFTVRKVPTSDTSAGNVLSGCKLIHIPQSAITVSSDPISRRLRSRFESSAVLNLVVRELGLQ
jgi:hypothetical protein